ncbi:MAG: HAMP domain-containing protein [Curvibacter sp.]|nr:HAMP domain-containing protein [Curvibacter sp.]
MSVHLRLQLQRISHRMWAGFALILLILAGLTALAEMRIHSLGQTLGQVAGEGARRSQAIRDMERAASLCSSLLRGLQTAPAQELEARLARIRQTDAQYLGAAQAASARLEAPQAQALIGQAESLRAQVMSLLTQAQKEAGDSGPAAVAMMVRLGFATDNALWITRLDDWGAHLRRLSDWDDQLVGSQAAEAQQASRTAQWMLAGGALLALVLATAMAWRMTRDVAGGLEQARQAALRMAEHDLSTPWQTRRGDEFGMLLESLEDMRRRLQVLAGGVRQSTDSIHQASSEISSASRHLSSRTESTAATLQRSGASLQALSDSVRHTSATARQADDMARQVQQTARDSESRVRHAADAMQGIEQSSKRISDIIGLIDGIAFQTNILALNAAVEAARAGEQGRGFAVVAAEVRTLAQRSAAAAREIKELIQHSLQKVLAGSLEVQQTVTSTQGLRQSVEQVSQFISGIAQQAQAQLTHIEDAAQASSELEMGAQQNAAMSEQAAASTEALHEQAARLSALVASFKLEPGMAEGGNPPEPPRRIPAPPAPRLASRPHRA